MKIFLTIFATIFLAELGDKTQLATLLFSTDKQVSKWLVFIAASSALVLATAIGVLAGDLLTKYINTQYLEKIAAVGFIVIGVWIFFRG